MRCKRVRKMLAGYVNEVLKSKGSRLVEEHIFECDSCRRELGVLRKILRLIDDVKVEYPPASVWENFLPDLHKRIESEAALVFRRQQKQRLYLLPGWVASAAVAVLIILAFVGLKYLSPVSLVQPQKAENIGMLGGSSPFVVENSSEQVLVAGVISKVLITEAEALELRKLKNFVQSETLTVPYYHDDDVLVDMSGETSGTEDEEDIIQFLLENEFAEFDENPVIESDGSEFLTM